MFRLVFSCVIGILEVAFIAMANPTAPSMMTGGEDFAYESANHNGFATNEPDMGFSSRTSGNVLNVTIAKYDGETLKELQSIPVRVDPSGVCHRWVSSSCYVRSYLDGRRLRVRVVLFPHHANQSGDKAIKYES
jgi:hypothetical protein